MGAMRSRVVEGPTSHPQGRAPISGVRVRVRPEEMGLQPAVAAVPGGTAASPAVAAPSVARSIPTAEPSPSTEGGIEDAVPLSGDAALAAIFVGTVALAGAWVAAFSLL